MSRAGHHQYLARLSRRARIYRAIPDGSHRARSPRAWLRALDDCPEYAVVRADAGRNIHLVCQALARHTDRRTTTTRPGWHLLAEDTGLSRATVQRVIRRLRGWGLIGVVETGSTWRTRGGRPDDDQDNRAGEYVLCTPAVDESDPPSLLLVQESGKPLAHAGENPVPWSMCRAPTTKGDQLAAAERLRSRAPVLARISARYLRHLLRPCFAAGWTPADVLHALDHVPDGTPHWYTADVRRPAAWVRHRLRRWQLDDGGLVAPPSQQVSRCATDLAPGDVTRMRRRDAVVAAAVDNDRQAGTARAMLIARSPGARRVIERRQVAREYRDVRQSAA